MWRQITLRLVLICILLLVLVPRDTIAQDTAAAQAAATEWLTHVDAGRYAESWTHAATFFKKAVTQEKWQEAIKQARDRVGTSKTRTISSAVPQSNPPGAPPGEYVIIQYSSVFELQPTAREMVTAVREADGAWRIVGYFVQ